MERRLPGLEPDERLLAHAPGELPRRDGGEHPVDVRARLGAQAASRRTTRGAMHADVAGFTDRRARRWCSALTDTRLVVWSTTFWLSRPGAIVGRGPARRRSHDVATARHGLVTGLAVALKNGQIVEVEAMRGRRLRHLADALQARSPSAGVDAGDSVRAP